METKICIKCNAEKSESEFSKGCNACKKCRCEHQKRYYKDNKERILSYQNSYNEAHRKNEEYKIYQTNWRKNNKEKFENYRKNGAKDLKYWYVVKNLTCTHGYELSEITPEMIKETRLRILKFRKKHETIYFDANSNFDDRLLQRSRKRYSA